MHAHTQGGKATQPVIAHHSAAMEEAIGWLAAREGKCDAEDASAGAMEDAMGWLTAVEGDAPASASRTADVAPSEPAEPPKKRHRSTAAEMALRRLTEGSKSEKCSRAAKAQSAHNKSLAIAATAKAEPELALVLQSADGITSTLSDLIKEWTTSKELAHNVNVSFLERKDVQKLSASYALLCKEVQKNTSLTNLAETLGKSRRTIKRMMSNSRCWLQGSQYWQSTPGHPAGSGQTRGTAR